MIEIIFLGMFSAIGFIAYSCKWFDKLANGIYERELQNV